MYNYLTFWNVLDWLSHFTLVLALFLRYVSQSEGQIYARNMYAISLLFIYLRFLEIFLVLKGVGTTVIMIKEMVPIFFSCVTPRIRTDIIRECRTSINIDFKLFLSS